MPAPDSDYNSGNNENRFQQGASNNGQGTYSSAGLPRWAQDAIQQLTNTGVPADQAYQWYANMSPSDRAGAQGEWEAAWHSGILGLGPAAGALEQWSAKYAKQIQTGQKELSDKEAYAAESTKMKSQIQQFIDMMNAPISGNDPIAKQLQQMGSEAASMGASNQGIQGGMANAELSNSTQRALLPYMQQRQQNAIHGMDMLANYDTQTQQVQQRWQGMQDDRSMQNWAAQQNKNQGVWGAVGGIGGSIAAIASGNPSMVGQWGQAGSKILGGIGGTGGGNPYPSYSGGNYGY